MKMPLHPVWDLESIFSGGSSSEAFASYLNDLDKDVRTLQQTLQQMAAPATLEDAAAYEPVLELLQSCYVRISEGSAFVSCLSAQNQQDKKAAQLQGAVSSIAAMLNSSKSKLDNIFSETPDVVWDQWLAQADIQPLSFVLNESRAQARDKMSPELEGLALDLGVDGYHGWGKFYNTIVSKVNIPFEQDGEIVMLSAGQAANKLSDSEREVRERVFSSWEQSWTEVEDFCADTLNHLAGFRLKLYEKRGWQDILKEPLAINRMSRQTLDAMWDVINGTKPVLVKYLERKAKLLGVDKLSWSDVDAPVGKSVGKVTYDEAALTIVEQFARFSPKLSSFAEMAFEKRWIEAEDRPGKRPGGFCTSLPLSKATRIFMTFSGTASNVSTLAHELGHGYHQHIMEELPALNQRYAMNVAETASTFAEMIVADALVQTARDEQEKLALLEDKIQRSVAFFMNIHARFLFETRFYEQRKKGLVSADELSRLMVEAQEEAFCGVLASTHPHFWASKLHFYLTGVPFYNFPYTFGYMFSAGIYARAQQEGTAFADKYDDLLRDTGRMTVEQLAQKHLGADLTQADFWQAAANLVIADIEQFMEMTENVM
ncbi:M3 family oligoendopeptidase [Paenibacillus silvae]|uniref:M3 family oligoendopeptidase n=1 Tax=Paenibacillus silvae TaxID=1325358 RepID=UPI0011A76F09|nr:MULTISPECIES: M3 family oligoendopeptidase [Paenibacillus]MCK6076321.1 M3 family oligoendopeptidase [Paenibacillus silvae]MCK6078324.1 M3 family oligoendopeptidase [Paenibacillus silvae]MCK6150520.1 M3 family oligoendopeptidase [Paenibacillus silvae]MCK6268780.1 M3 family oligoendopeptidase [Paenibacillus silvae]MCK6270373.1 M3 family oligoendopeptidase [Paenibacillus silvae]